MTFYGSHSCGAYNAVYNYDIIGIVEIHLDSIVDEEKLALNGYLFIKNKYPQHARRGGVGLYIKDSLPQMIFLTW